MTMSIERKLAIFSFFSGVVLGYLSILVTNFTKIPLLNIFLVAIYIVLSKFVLEASKLVEKNSFKWWFSKCFWMLILFWFVFWTIFVNLVYDIA